MRYVDGLIANIFGPESARGVMGLLSLTYEYGLHSKVMLLKLGGLHTEICDWSQIFGTQ